jgi:hypothetical protein
MPYKDKAKQAAAQQRYRLQKLEAQRERERVNKRRQRRTERSHTELDERPLACLHRFFTTRSCRRKARFHSPSGARWCAVHAEGKPQLLPL